MTEKTQGSSSKNEEDYDYLFKIVMVGNSGVGKSSIVSRFMENEFCSDPQPTTGVQLATKLVKMDGKTIKAQIWDTSGYDYEGYRALPSVYYPGTVGVILVYDVTKWGSFISMNKWLKEVRDNTQDNIVKILVGNKTDSMERVIATEDGWTVADKNYRCFFKYMETSALESTSVEKLFQVMLTEIYNKIKWLRPLVEKRVIEDEEEKSADVLTQ